MIRVWDRPVRVLHWGLALSVGLAWATTEWLGAWHQAVGYAGLALLAARIGWGFVGSRFARFAQFVRAPAATWRYARLVRAGREPRYLGHNPLGACMVLAVFACLGALALTGWLYTTDVLWGNETVERIHRALAWSMLALAALHVAGVLVASIRHRENLIASMTHGDKREAGAGDID